MASRHKLTSVGFTLIELLVVLAIAMLLVASAEPSYHLFLSQAGAQDAATVYVQSLRRAQTLSQAAQADSSWGVYIATSTVVLYKGTSYASRNSTYDEKYSGVSFTVSGVSEVVFAKLTGMPSTAGTTTILAGTQAKVVTINAKGIINY